MAHSRRERGIKSEKSKKSTTRKTSKPTQPSPTLILCATACLAIVVGLYFTNKTKLQIKHQEANEEAKFNPTYTKTGSQATVKPDVKPTKMPIVKPTVAAQKVKPKKNEKKLTEAPGKSAQDSKVKFKTKTKRDPNAHFKTLPRIDGVNVGHVQRIELSPGKIYEVKTRSLRPLIFEIPEFLTDNECQQIIDQSIRQGLETSEVQDPETGISIEPTTKKTFSEWDYNEDGMVSVLEIMHNLIDLSDLYFTEQDVMQMFKDLNVDKNRNGVMDLDEFLHVTTDRVMRYLHKLAQGLPRIKSRNSRQNWVDHTVIEGLDERVGALTKLPISVIEGSEKLQVVNYGPEGHYHCHHDSQDIDNTVPCCYEHDKRHCRLCRYITVLYFLNDVEEGGETAFPVANNATFSIEAWAGITKYRCDLSRHCHKANLFVKPKKRTAIMWYNHFRDEKTGWFGRLDATTYHGGCDVIKGRKWIANNWINIMGESRDTMFLHTNPKTKVRL